MKLFNLKQDGFSLVETLVAITILLVVVVGPMTISTSTARSTSFSSEQVVAFFLAQEGAEIAQMVRDDFLLNDTSDIQGGWNDFVRNESSNNFMYNCFQSPGCLLELNTDSAGSIKNRTLCNDGNCRLYVDIDGDTRSKYTHDSSGNEPTPYSRIIKLEEVATNPNEIKVISTVTWRTGNQRQSQSVSVETHLFNVYGN
jgi:prepilin-type N-terminal cleavage/methylation domain-containing protein